MGIRKFLQFLQADYGLRLFRIDELPHWQILIDPQDSVSLRAVQQSSNAPFVLGAQVGSRGLITSTHYEGVQQIATQFNSLLGYPIHSDELEPPLGTRVINLSYGSRETEETLFGDVFSQPIQELFINDRYLIDEERIVNRMGEYIRLAQQQGALTRVIFRANQAGRSGTDRKSTRLNSS